MPGIDHVMINCCDYEAAVRFYSWLLPRIGFPELMVIDEPAETTGWYGINGSIWVSRAAGPDGLPFNKERAGLRELAFRADSRADIDDLAQEIESHGGRILDAPREYRYVPGYYAVFFTDPDGIKLELVHLPQSQS
jgi:catechol 2,3-dioxygenase-like lactoylglutathione lyase family enzyme